MFTLKLRSAGVGAAAVALVCATAVAADTPPRPAEDDVRVVINPQPRDEVGRETVAAWSFQTDAAGWEPTHHIGSVEVAEGALAIESTGNDPYLFGPPLEVPAAATMRVRLRLRSEAAGGGQVFWETAEQPGFAEHRSTRFDVEHDGRWHEYEVPITPTGTLTRLRLDPAEAPGSLELAWVKLEAVERHPLEIDRIATDGEAITASVRYHGETAAEVRTGMAYKSGPRESEEWVTQAVEGPGVSRVPFVPEDQQSPVARVDLEASVGGYEPVRRRIRLHREDVTTPESWETIEDDAGVLSVRLHPRSLFARVYRGGERVALIGPLVMLANGESLGMDVDVADSGDRATLTGEGATVELAVKGEHLHATVEAEAAVEALVTRVIGDLEQGLLPGVEYLGEGEWSSSRADIETAEHVRFAPPPMDVTLPLLAMVTDRAAMGLLYDEPGENRPVFATPNFIDGAADHRMAVRGERIEAVLYVGAGWAQQRLEDVIAWAVDRRGLPEVAERPRSTQAQFELSLAALQGVLRDDAGWGHAAEERWERRFFADHASTIWRLTGEMPDVPELVPGGAHLRDDAAYLVSGRAEQWLERIGAEAAHLRRKQREDGSFGYEGEYARTHFEDTASGYNAQRAATLLNHARLTGDAASQEAGLKTLAYMKRFRTPRGAQTWEIPLHTPDILAAAHLVRAYVLGYELTGEGAYLDEARRWAIAGLPFVYHWRAEDARGGEAMAYATIAVYGATNWRAPNWIGLPVQWCGLVYADALLDLAEHDTQGPDWRQVAEGIVVSAEWQMHAEGELAGTLPDWFVPATGERGGPSINPCALVSLRLRLEGDPARLAVAEAEGRRIVAPYPVTIEGGTAQIDAEPGERYEVVIDGNRVLSVTSDGVDKLNLPD